MAAVRSISAVKDNQYDDRLSFTLTDHAVTTHSGHKDAYIDLVSLLVVDVTVASTTNVTDISAASAAAAAQVDIAVSRHSVAVPRTFGQASWPDDRAQ